MDRRTFLHAGGALALAACATPRRGEFEAAAVPAPQWRVGDSWTFRRTDGYNGLPRGVLTRRVESIDPGGIRFITVDEIGRVHDDALFESPGIEVSGTLSEDTPRIGTFAPPLRMYEFPLVSGKEWRQAVHRTDSNGYRIYMTASIGVEGWEEVRAGDKAYRALVIRRTFMLGPGYSYPYFRNLNREEVEWYVPELRSPARIRTYEWYPPHAGGLGIYPGNFFHDALESFRLA
jgi:hypothetical protein